MDSCAAHRPIMAAPRVGFIGLGAMGSGMASVLAKKDVPLTVFDVRPEAAKRLEELGAKRAETVQQCAECSDVLVLAVLNAQQVSSVLFDGQDAVFNGSFRGICVSCATVPPAFAEEIAARVAALGDGAAYVDAPMSGGSIKAASGQLTFMASGEDSALSRCRGVLEKMGRVFVLGNQSGLGSKMKSVNQILAGVHIVAAAEAMAFAAKGGLDTQQVFEIIKECAGNSFMFENRVPHMLADDPTPHSAVDIWPKDLGIVLDESKRIGMPCPMTSQAMQQFLAARGLGHGGNDDSFVVKVYEALGGAPVATAPAPPAKKPRLSNP